MLKANKIVVITGISSGIGLITAKTLIGFGYIVYGGSRNATKNEELKQLGVHTFDLDLTNPDSISNFVKQVLNETNYIDVLINCAGYGLYGAVEDVSIEEAKKEFEVNVFGLVNITQLFLPSMRARKQGLIINISSMAGRITALFGGWYHASKYAVEALSDCLRQELMPYNIKVVIIEPGMVKTNWGNIAQTNLMKVSQNTVYKEEATTVGNWLKTQYCSNTNLTDPHYIADVIVKVIRSSNPKTRYLIGNSAKSTVFFKNILSDKQYDKILRRKLLHERIHKKHFHHTIVQEAKKKHKNW